MSNSQHPYSVGNIISSGEMLEELLEYLEDIIEGREAEEYLINKRTKEAQVIEDYDRAMRGI